MAFSVSNDRVAPDVSLVAGYIVHRLAMEARVMYSEVKRVMEPPIQIGVAMDNDEDELFETLVFDDRDSSLPSLQGRELEVEEKWWKKKLYIYEQQLQKLMDNKLVPEKLRDKLKDKFYWLQKDEDENELD